MNWNEFNITVVRNERPEAIELDLRPFGVQQNEAVDFWLDAALKQGDPFGKRVVVKTDASVILSQSARACLAKLQQQGVSVSVVGER
jgi:hypothetical protein